MGGDDRAALAQTVTGKRLNLYGSMTCSGKNITHRLFPTTDEIATAPGTPLLLSVLNVSCAQPNGATQVTVVPGGQTINLLDDGNAPDLAAGDGIYTGQWTPSAAGTYTLTFSTGDVIMASVLNSYVVAPAAYNYRSIVGTNLNLGDDDTIPITPPEKKCFP